MAENVNNFKFFLFPKIFENLSLLGVLERGISTPLSSMAEKANNYNFFFFFSHFPKIFENLMFLATLKVAVPAHQPKFGLSSIWPKRSTI